MKNPDAAIINFISIWKTKPAFYQTSMHDDVIKWKRFFALLAICAGNSPVPAQRPVRFDVLFDLRLNKRLSKQSWGWWFDRLSRPLWRHRNGIQTLNFTPPLRNELSQIELIFLIVVGRWCHISEYNNLYILFWSFCYIGRRRVAHHRRSVLISNYRDMCVASLCCIYDKILVIFGIWPQLCPG